MKTPGIEFQRIVSNEEGVGYDSLRVSASGDCIGCEHAAICLLANIKPNIRNMRLGVPTLAETPVDVGALLQKGVEVEVSAEIIAANAGMYICELAALESTTRRFDSVV